MDSAMASIRLKAPSEVLDYGFLMDCLKNYGFPRKKLTQLLKKGALIRVKKGLYVFGPLFSRSPYSREMLANMIYGPSYVSLEWALQTYGMIPERVEEITSVTLKRTRMFTTPLGRFSYSHRHFLAYPEGVVRQQNSEYQAYLIATPEKALVDLLVIRRGQVSKMSELKELLFEDLRLEEEDLQRLNLDLVKKINSTYPHSTVTLLIKLLSQD